MWSRLNEGSGWFVGSAYKFLSFSIENKCLSYFFSKTDKTIFKGENYLQNFLITFAKNSEYLFKTILK